jgi:hypothetical protein
MLDALRALEEQQHARVMDPEIDARIAQYEMAYRMQTSVPDAMQLADEPDAHLRPLRPRGARARHLRRQLPAGAAAGRARRALHPALSPGLGPARQPAPDIQIMPKSVDQASAALVLDLKQRGLLDDTLVIWGGEFGRTNYSQGKLTKDNYGRDHHPRCFSIWMAGGGVKAGHHLRRDRRVRLQHRARSGARARLPGHAAAPARHRPRAARVPPPGAALPLTDVHVVKPGLLAPISGRSSPLPSICPPDSRRRAHGRFAGVRPAVGPNRVVAGAEEPAPHGHYVEGPSGPHAKRLPPLGPLDPWTLGPYGRGAACIPSSWS